MYVQTLNTVPYHVSVIVTHNIQPWSDCDCVNIYVDRENYNNNNSNKSNN